jgi:putative ABC transport system permease protein
MMTTGGPIDIGLGNLLLAAALIGLTAALSAWQQLGLTRSVVIGGIRASVQLLLVALVLQWIFGENHWYLVLATLLLMVAVAGHTALGRIADSARRRRILGIICTASIFIGSALTLAYVDLLVIKPCPGTTRAT